MKTCRSCRAGYDDHLGLDYEVDTKHAGKLQRTLCNDCCVRVLKRLIATDKNMARRVDEIQ